MIYSNLRDRAVCTSWMGLGCPWRRSGKVPVAFWACPLTDRETKKQQDKESKARRRGGAQQGFRFLNEGLPRCNMEWKPGLLDSGPWVALKTGFDQKQPRNALSPRMVLIGSFSWEKRKANPAGHQGSKALLPALPGTGHVPSGLRTPLSEMSGLGNLTQAVGSWSCFLKWYLMSKNSKCKLWNSFEEWTWLTYP